MTADIDELMGIAMGCIGMSMQDFCQCTPSEFMSIYKAWIKSREQTERNAWERARISCLCSLQPYSKKRLKATDIMEFPWEKEKIPCNREKLSASEEMERYKAAKRKYGLT